MRKTYSIDSSIHSGKHVAKLRMNVLNTGKLSATVARILQPVDEILFLCAAFAQVFRLFIPCNFGAFVSVNHQVIPTIHSTNNKDNV
jgi:hypothetical protein